MNTMTLVTLAFLFLPQAVPNDVIFVVNGWHNGTYPAELGTSVAAVGDVNADGFADFLMGAPQDNSTLWNTDSGGAYLRSGFDGYILASWHGSYDYSGLGHAVAAPGDVTGDGIDDFLIGAYYAGANVEGEVQVFSGDGWAQVYKHTGPVRGGAFGYALAACGDVDQDGSADYLIGAPWTQASGSSSKPGAAYLYSGATGSVLFQWAGLNDDYRFGNSLSGGGDVNGDGWLDVIIGEVPDSDTRQGAAYVYSGQDGSLIHQISGSINQRDRFAWSVAILNDLNGDGHSEFIVGAPYAVHDRKGQATVYSGADASVLYQFTGATNRDQLGIWVTNIGDRNQDQIEDFLIGGFADPIGGEVMIHSGANGSHLKTIGGNGALCVRGNDINADGKEDLLFGNAGASYSNGAVYVFGENPLLVASADTISAAAGGTVRFHVNFTAADGGLFYAILASANGIGPTVVGGLSIPLTNDALFQLTATGWPIPYMTGQMGTLSMSGNGLADLILPPAVAGPLVGNTYHFAAVSLILPNNGLSVSEPVAITVLP